MARTPAAAPPVRKTYIVRRDDLQTIGGIKVNLVDGKRTVKMTAAEAQYWLDQHAIGEDEHNPETDGGLTKRPQQAHNIQTSRGGVPSARPADPLPGETARNAAEEDPVVSPDQPGKHRRR